MLARLRPRRPAHGTVVAYLALFAALGGSSYAAVKVGSRQIADNSVRSADLRNNDVRGKDVRQNSLTGTDVAEQTLAQVPSAAQAATAATADSAARAATADTAANAATLGGQGPAAFARAPLWANVAVSGSILGQSGGISATFLPTSNGYSVDFGRDVRDRPISVDSLIRTDDPGARGTTLGGVCDDATFDCSAVGVPNDGRHAFVVTLNPANSANAAHGFSIVLH